MMRLGTCFILEFQVSNGLFYIRFLLPDEFLLGFIQL